jgi:hypothetical protein
MQKRTQRRLSRNHREDSNAPHYSDSGSFTLAKNGPF